MKTFLQFLNEAKSIFSSELPVYHGTSRDFEHFDSNVNRNPTTPSDEIKGHFFTPDANTAYTHASRMAKSIGGKPRVIKANLHFKNPKDVTKEIKKHQKTGLTFSQAKRKAYSEVDQNKHDGILFHGDNYNSPEYVAFHHSSIKQIT